MSQVAEALSPSQAAEASAPVAPIVVVGNGPVGMRVARELLQRLPGQSVIIYGDEQHEPYNRVRLSSWLAGEVDWQGLAQPLDPPLGACFEERIGYRVESIDRDHKRITDNSGQVQPYSRLILATGSSPFVPNIPGIDKSGVFTFRDLDDTNKLLARRVRSHHTVVLGGGLLGLEAARGMQRANTQVTVVEHADRLLGHQLDEDGAAELQHDVESLGVRVVIGDGVAEVLGGERVTGVQLRSGLTIKCDTIVVATGIRPNIGLAKEFHLKFGRGIQVDDRMRTSDDDIYAVGECAEHRGEVYGLVAPGLEQAAVAAADIAGIESHYAGSVAASRLKVVGTQVFSMGPMGAGENRHNGKAYVYRDDDKGIYRKILVKQHRLIGAIGIGDWNETVRLQTFIGRTAVIWPWQIMRFLRTGFIWPAEDSQSVAAWPATTIVCQCTNVTRGTLSDAIAKGACTTEAVCKATGASSVCGSCKPLVNDLIGGGALKPVALSRTLLVSGTIALIGALLMLFAPAIPYADSVQHAWHWDVLWRDGLLKQITGFTILGLFVIGLLVSLRKRTPVLNRLGKFDGWRLAHIVLGLLVVVTLLAHTGLRLGNGLNFLLMASFSLMLLLGGFSSGVIALEHRIGGAIATRLRRQSVWFHILLFWPVPALLGWHIFKTYWY
ncbi:FAD-dependent oxidoreductase [Thiosocius teredinicola]|uniref:FAD-dependent oxidoreductase n=1 Tax=Thiosocius teredinicola TaxID=1973002 RepID=UPI0013DE0357